MCLPWSEGFYHDPPLMFLPWRRNFLKKVPKGKIKKSATFKRSIKSKLKIFTIFWLSFVPIVLGLNRPYIKYILFSKKGRCQWPTSKVISDIDNGNITIFRCFYGNWTHDSYTPRLLCFGCDKLAKWKLYFHRLIDSTVK